MAKRTIDEIIEKTTPTKRSKFSIDSLLEEVEPVEEPKPSQKQSNSREGPLGVECRLEGAELWSKFHELGTEMIITKSGRRMFPTVKVSVSKVQADSLYYVFLDVVPVDAKRYRYIYNKSAWLTAGKAEQTPKNRLYLHPDSPFTGDQIRKQVISFEKAKLTNNDVDKTGHLILNSMHKYQPRIHVVRRNSGNPLNYNQFNLTDEEYCTYVFPNTQFMAVTAYQNQLITKLKIEKNPFAKGFRDPSGRSPEYEPERNEAPPMLGVNIYPHQVLQQALLQQYYSKSSAIRNIPPLPPNVLSQMLLYPFGLNIMPPPPESPTTAPLET